MVGNGLSVAIAVALIAAPAPAQTLGALAFVDARPADDARARFLSVSVFSCDYFIKEVSDEGRAVERGAALKAALAQGLGALPAAHRLDLHSYRVFLNAAGAEMEMAVAVAAASVGGSSVGARAVRPAPKCAREKTPHGWFDPTETSNPNPPLVVEVSATLEGAPLVVRSVYSPAIPLSTINKLMPAGKAKRNLADAKSAPEVAKAMDKANAAVLAQVLARIGRP